MCFISPGGKWGLEKNLLAVFRFFIPGLLGLWIQGGVEWLFYFAW